MSLENQIEELEEEVLKKLSEPLAARELEELQVATLGKKGRLTAVLRGLKDLSPEDRKTAGALANETRGLLEKRFSERKREIAERELQERLSRETYDALRPLGAPVGGLHPVTQIQYRLEDIFTSMGFRIMDGPEAETDENNFGKLNFSADHPAREDHDTFWTEDGHLLRTHTSSVQMRAMSSLSPPFRVVAPGRVFRNEELDASHENTFHQIEGMMVDRDVSVANLIFVMKNFLSAIFEKEIKVRLRPGYFPFVEPGFELDFSCLLCGGQGCRACKQEGWIEFMGCGLVHPNVLREGGLDPNEWSGFAFGMGLDRLVMLLYGIEDIRHFMSGNLRFLKQF